MSRKSRIKSKRKRKIPKKIPRKISRKKSKRNRRNKIRKRYKKGGARWSLDIRPGDSKWKVELTPPPIELLERNKEIYNKDKSTFETLQIPYLNKLYAGKFTLNPPNAGTDTPTQILAPALAEEALPENFYDPIDYVNNIHIIPCILCRLGWTKHDIDKNQNLKEDITNIIDYHIQLLYYLEDKYDNMLPSVYDSFIIDTKIHYMELLLQYNLCDPNTILLYFDMNILNENKSLRSQKTLENIETMFNDNITEFYIKTPFSGDADCIAKSPKPISKIKSNIYRILLRTFFGGTRSRFNKKGVKRDTKYEETCKCIGKFYGLIIQPYNAKFTVTEKQYGEIRCLCHNGEIKAIMKSDPRLLFSTQVMHKSIYQNIINDYDFNIQKNEEEDQFIKEICLQILTEIPNYTYTSDYGKDFENILNNSNVIQLCKETYDILKKHYSIEGNHHRIDLINSRDDTNNTKYIVNEIENINFGIGSNSSLFLRPVIKSELYTFMNNEETEISENLKQKYPQFLDDNLLQESEKQKRFDLLNKLRSEKIINEIFSMNWSSRQLLLSFR